MLWRPLDEFVAKYKAPSAALEDAGFFAGVLYGTDFLRFSLDLASERVHGFNLALRQRGAFIFNDARHVYRVPDALDIGALCVRLVRSFVEDGIRSPSSSDFFRRHGLERVSSWSKDEFEEREKEYQLFGWFDLPKEQERRAWSVFESKLSPEGRPEPSPSIVWDIGAAYAEDLVTDTEPELTAKTLGAMQAISSERCFWYVFYDCNSVFGFRPWQATPRPYRCWWKAPILPRDSPPRLTLRANHACFVREDFGAGLLTYLHEDSLCVFGRDLLDALERDPPALFRKPRRRNGIPVLLTRLSDYRAVQVVSSWRCAPGQCMVTEGWALPVVNVSGW